MRNRDSSLPRGVKITKPYSEKENFYTDLKKLVLIIKIRVLRIYLGLLDIWHFEYKIIQYN